MDSFNKLSPPPRWQSWSATFYRAYIAVALMALLTVTLGLDHF